MSSELSMTSISLAYRSRVALAHKLMRPGGSTRRFKRKLDRLQQISGNKSCSPVVLFLTSYHVSDLKFRYLALQILNFHSTSVRGMLHGLRLWRAYEHRRK